MAIVDSATWVRRLAMGGGRARLQFANLGRALGKNAEERAKNKLGEYQGESGPFPAWAALAESTITEKSDKGFPVPSPLLRTGELRESISWRVVKEDANSIVVELSAADPAEFHEFGTVNMPPRPFLGPSIYEAVEEISSEDLEEMMMYMFGFDDIPVTVTLKVK